MIIENINNEKSNGQVAITRTIAGLKAKVEIYPFNMDFCINEYEANIHKRKYKKTIDTLIDSDGQFTVVLMMRGGVDEKFFKVFKFMGWLFFQFKVLSFVFKSLISHEVMIV